MRFFRLSIVLLTGAFLLGSCLKQKYDAPPSTATYDPNLPVHASLKQISKLATSRAAGTWRKMGDTTITGVVISSDFTGNFYKNLIIEDTSKNGIILYIEQSYLYADFPVGRKLYIKLNGLYLMNYRGFPEIVYDVDSVTGSTTGIPSGLINDYIVKATYPNFVTPEEVTIMELRSNPSRYLGALVKINDCQFKASDAGIPYSVSSSSGSGASRTVENCAHTSSTVMYNSAYATFQPKLTPTGNGSLTAIVSTFYSTQQLLIRDTADVQFTNPRCP